MNILVEDLIKELQKLDPKSIVILQKDSEGNGYSPLSGIDGNAVYVPDNTWSGTAFSRDYSAEDYDWDQDEYDELMSNPSCCVLVPIN